MLCRWELIRALSLFSLRKAPGSCGQSEVSLMEKMVPPSASAFLVPVLLTFTLVHTLYYFVLENIFLSTISYLSKVSFNLDKSCMSAWDRGVWMCIARRNMQLGMRSSSASTYCSRAAVSGQFGTSLNKWQQTQYLFKWLKQSKAWDSRLQHKQGNLCFHQSRDLRKDSL